MYITRALTALAEQIPFSTITNPATDGGADSYASPYPVTKQEKYHEQEIS
jgi:hypothetical protein